MKKITLLTALLALLAAPMAVAANAADPAGDTTAGQSCCAGKGSKADKTGAKTCNPADCKKSDTCTADEKAKCAMHSDAKPQAKEAPKAAAAPKS